MFIAMSGFSQSPFFHWAKSFGGTQFDNPTSAVTDSAGNVYVCGFFEDSVDFNTEPGVFQQGAVGQYDVFVSKWDSNGNWLWTKTFGSYDYDAAEGIALDSQGNIVVTGFFYGTVDFDPGPAVYNLTFRGGVDIFVLKLDSNGNFIWAKQMGGYAADAPSGIALDPFDNIIITGSFQGTANFDTGSSSAILTSAGNVDIFIAKLDPSGNFLFVKQLGGPQIEETNNVKTDKNGNIIVCGELYDTIDLDPGPSVYMSAPITNYPSTAIHYNAFLLKLNAAGDFIYAKEIAGGYSIGKDVAVDNNNNILLCGSYRDTIDIDPGPGITTAMATSFKAYVLKIDSAGNFQWTKLLSGGSSDGSAITTTQNGSIILAGSFGTGIPTDFDPGAGTESSTVYGASDVYVLELDSTGSFNWVSFFRGQVSGLSYGTVIAIVLDNNENIITTGTLERSMDFDPDYYTTYGLSSVGNQDVYVQKMGFAPTAINEAAETANPEIFPNPATSVVYVPMEHPNSLLITNALGQTVYYSEKTESLALNIADWAEGMYFVHTGDLKHTTKLIKLKK